MTDDHRSSDDSFTAIERAVASADWQRASTALARFREELLRHFDAEESVLFPLFEQRTGIHRGPTQVMRGEHAQMRMLLQAAAAALADEDGVEYASHAETLLIMLQQHNVKEENVLYPMCDQQLGDQYDDLLPELRRRIAGHAR